MLVVVPGWASYWHQRSPQQSSFKPPCQPALSAWHSVCQFFFFSFSLPPQLNQHHAPSPTETDCTNFHSPLLTSNNTSGGAEHQWRNLEIAGLTLVRASVADIVRTTEYRALDGREAWPAQQLFHPQCLNLLSRWSTTWQHSGLHRYQMHALAFSRLRLESAIVTSQRGADNVVPFEAFLTSFLWSCCHSWLLPK